LFPLAGKTFPRSGDALADSIRDALAEVLTLPKKGTPVTVDAPKYPAIKSIKVDLSDAAISVEEPPTKPKPTGKREPGVHVDRLEVTGRPVRYETSKLELDLKAKNVDFDFGKDKGGQALLVLTAAEEGSVDAKISKADIRTLATAAATAAAKQQGVTVQDVEVDLRSQGKRSVTADVRVKAKKMLVSGVIRITGRLDVDDELNATISELDCTGEGMVGTVAAAALRSKLKPYNGRQVPLVAFSLGDVVLRDLKIDVKNGLHVTAGFGGK